MTRVKKSRKVGKIGIAKSDTPRKVKKTQLAKSTNTAGNKAGSRQQLSANHLSNGASKEKLDPRIGSKKSIDLNKYKGGSAPLSQKRSRFTNPQDELDAIEQDHKLEQLLAKQEHQKLSFAENDYVVKTLARHKALCELLGIELLDEESEQETDPFAMLDAIKIEDFKH